MNNANTKKNPTEKKPQNPFFMEQYTLLSLLPYKQV